VEEEEEEEEDTAEDDVATERNRPDADPLTDTDIADAVSNAAGQEISVGVFSAARTPLGVLFVNVCLARWSSRGR